MKTFQDNLFRELIVDNFAGGGGASTGIELALGQPVDIAINHDEMAIKMHSYNHPHTLHLQNDVFAIDPVEVTGGRAVGLAWFSPDCTHFSKAKGGKPRKKEIRDLAWVVIKWAKAVKPRIIMLENVEEFKTWGPLDDDGYPIKELSGETFNEWLSQLKDLGYAVETKELIAADFGAPTTRKRLFIIARCDGQPIVWPTPTHSKTGKDGLKKWRSAAEIIDFSDLGTSIFERNKPLAENTLRRIARGIEKFVLKNPSPFLMSYHSETQPNEVRGHSIGEPLPTQGTANRFGLVAPGIVKIGQTGFSDDRSSDIREPLKTVVSKNEDILINSAIVPVGYGEAPGQAPRVQSIEAPINTIVSHSVKHHVVSFIGKAYSGNQVHASDAKEPLPTVTSVDHNQLISLFITKYYSDNNGQIQGSKVDDPLSTITTAERNGLIAVNLIEYYGNSIDGSRVDAPIKTITANDRHAIVSINLDTKMDIKYWPKIREILNKYCYVENKKTRERTYSFNLKDDEILLIKIGDVYYIMNDIMMRMLFPEELKKGQGFPLDYDITCNNEMNKTEQVRKLGNSVCPPLPYALVKANYEVQNVPPLSSMRQLFHYMTYGNLRTMKSKDGVDGVKHNH